jgi:oxaloacetate decarboxylase alpha subunit
MSIRFVDTTIRDGQASLWAMNMRTRHLVPILPSLDAAGFDSIEFIATGSRLKKFVRDLRENPWDWINLGPELAKLTPLRWHGSIDGASMSGRVSAEIGDLLVQKAVERGVRYTRTGNNWNNFKVLAPELERFKRYGMTPVVHIMYSVSPKHTDEYFVQRTREAAALAPWRLCLKDVSGMLTPERTRELLPKLMEVSGNIPWEFHGHCNNGLGPLNALEAARLGVEYLHVAVPPLSNGSSLPSVFTLASNLREEGFAVDLDEEPLRDASRILHEIADVENMPVGVPLEYDARLYRHQVPGGMISNLRYQLEQTGQGDRLDEVLEETARVRADFGYPIMVTPLSQYIGTQAAVNVIVGERYRQVTDSVIEYALGRHGGSEATEGMDQDVRHRILDRSRAREIAERSVPELTLADARRKYGDIPDEDLILRAIVGDDAVDVVGSVADPPREIGSNPTSLIKLIETIADQHDLRTVRIAMGTVRLSMDKCAAETPAVSPRAAS